MPGLDFSNRLVGCIVGSCGNMVGGEQAMTKAALLWPQIVGIGFDSSPSSSIALAVEHKLARIEFAAVEAFF